MPRSQSRTPPAGRSPAKPATDARRRARSAKDAAAEHRGGAWGRAFSARLRALMRAQGQGVIRFAERVGLAKSLISAYLNGTRLPETPTLRQIAERTGVSLDWLLLGDGGEGPRWREQMGPTRPRAELAEDVRAFLAHAILWRTGDGRALEDVDIEVDGAGALDTLAAWAVRRYEANVGRTVAYLDGCLALAWMVRDVAHDVARGCAHAAQAEQERAARHVGRLALKCLESAPPLPRLGRAFQLTEAGATKLGQVRVRHLMDEVYHRRRSRRAVAEPPSGGAPADVSAEHFWIHLAQLFSMPPADAFPNLDAPTTGRARAAWHTMGSLCVVRFATPTETTTPAA